MVRPGKSAEEVESLISEEVSRLVAEPVTSKELERAHAAIRRGVLLPRESVLFTAITLADSTALYNDPNRINTEYEKQLAVTAADIQNAARKYLRTTNRVVVNTVPAAAAMAPKPAAPKPN
jgi:zinc protease